MKNTKVIVALWAVVLVTGSIWASESENLIEIPKKEENSCFDGWVDNVVHHSTSIATRIGSSVPAFNDLCKQDIGIGGNCLENVANFINKKFHGENYTKKLDMPTGFSAHAIEYGKSVLSGFGGKIVSYLLNYVPYCPSLVSSLVGFCLSNAFAVHLNRLDVTKSSWATQLSHTAGMITPWFF